MEVSVDPVARRRSRVLDAFESRYTCIHEPLPASASAYFASSDDNNNNNNKRYLTSLRVFSSREVEEPPQSSLPTSSSNLVVDQNIKEKVAAALKVLCFREPRVLVQFWSPVAVQKRCLLTTLDQPFGLGVVDEGLYKYRLESEQRMFVVDGEHREDLGPPGRVYRQKLPEWSLGMHGLSTRQSVQDWAASHNIHGYINLPVFEPRSECCVGVLELITSSKYADYAFEVRQVSRALKEENLKSPNVFEDTSLYACVGDDKRQLELNEIFWMLKTICDIHNLPLAQTWSLCKYNSVVARSGILERSCSSYSRNCIGKACMSIAALPFHVRDLSMWGFHETCGERHLDKSQGVVGRSLSSHGLCFCGDVSKLGEEEYPLHLNARKHGLTSCLAIYLKSPEVDAEYVIELFLPTRSESEADLQSLVKTVKQQFKNTSRIQLGDMSSPHVIGGVPPTLNIEYPTLTEKEDVPPELENLHLRAKNGNNDCGVDVACSKKESEFAHVEHMEEDKLSDSDSAGTNENVDINTGKRKGKDIDFSKKSARRRKRSDTSISLEEINKYFGKTIDEAADSLHVSKSTLRRICRSLGIRRWPYSRTPNESDPLLKSDQTDAAVDASDRALTTLVLGTSKATTSNHDPAVLTEHSKHTSQIGLHRTKQNDLPDGRAKPETTIKAEPLKNIAANTYTIKVTDRENTVKFSFGLSDGVAKLEKLVATRFQLSAGSFRLKYEDEDGDLIWIACDNDLTASLNVFRQPDGQTVIRVTVTPA